MNSDTAEPASYQPTVMGLRTGGHYTGHDRFRPGGNPRRPYQTAGARRVPHRSSHAKVNKTNSNVVITFWAWGLRVVALADIWQDLLDSDRLVRYYEALASHYRRKHSFTLLLLAGCTAPGEGMFTGVAVELDADNRIFTTLPVLPVER